MATVEKGKKGFKPKQDGWKCAYCKSSFRTRRDLYAHFKLCNKRSLLKMNSLGRVINFEAAKRGGETLKKKYKSGELIYKAHSQSEETRKKISRSRIKYLESHNNHGLYWYNVNGVKVQGTWEKKFAEFLLSKNISFERRKIIFLKTHRYTPDFYCPLQNIYFEVKGFRRDRDIYKMYLVLDEHPELHIKMIEKDQIENLDKIDIFKLPDFQELYHREDIDMTKFNNVWGYAANGETGRS